MSSMLWREHVESVTQQCAERLAMWWDPQRKSDLGENYGEAMFGVDCMLLAEAYVKLKASQASEAEERAKPVDREWLESIGFESVTSDLGPNYSAHMQIQLLNLWESGPGEWVITGADQFSFRTRGEVLDLLKALKIPVKQ